MTRLAWMAALAACLWPRAAGAWGALGHRISAETAALLLREREPAGLGDLLARHRFELGVYAFVPDMRFRHEDGRDGAVEAPLHFFSLDAALRVAPRARWAQPWAAVRDDVRDLGRVPWRAAQLFDLAHGAWQRVHAVGGGYERGATATGDTRAVFDALFYMGVLAHYAADAAVPHHASADANSVRTGQNGLHFYFEGDCVDALEPGLASRVLARARHEATSRIAALGGAEASVEGLMVAMLAQSLDALPRLEKVDADAVVIARADPATPALARRRPRAEGCPALAEIVEDRLVAASVLVAQLWQRAVPSGIDWSRSASLQFSDVNDHGFIAFPP